MAILKWVRDLQQWRSLIAQKLRSSEQLVTIPAPHVHLSSSSSSSSSSINTSYSRRQKHSRDTGRDSAADELRSNAINISGKDGMAAPYRVQYALDMSPHPLWSNTSSSLAALAGGAGGAGTDSGFPWRLFNPTPSFQPAVDPASLQSLPCVLILHGGSESFGYLPQPRWGYPLLGGFDIARWIAAGLSISWLRPRAKASNGHHHNQPHHHQQSHYPLERISSHTFTRFEDVLPQLAFVSISRPGFLSSSSSAAATAAASQPMTPSRLLHLLLHPKRWLFGMERPREGYEEETEMIRIFLSTMMIRDLVVVAVGSAAPVALMLASSLKGQSHNHDHSHHQHHLHYHQHQSTNVKGVVLVDPVTMGYRGPEAPSANNNNSDSSSSSSSSAWLRPEFLSNVPQHLEIERSKRSKELKAHLAGNDILSDIWTFNRFSQSVSPKPDDNFAKSRAKSERLLAAIDGLAGPDALQEVINDPRLLSLYSALGVCFSSAGQRKHGVLSDLLKRETLVRHPNWSNVTCPLLCISSEALKSRSSSAIEDSAEARRRHVDYLIQTVQSSIKQQETVHSGTHLMPLMQMSDIVTDFIYDHCLAVRN
ncbi:hypothetical protein GQ42DRAFT_22899 [Ramicandelaber brevisporus]|nr:hypothetical protein GQ42DRAFT_22899 [Ramicandelaber brevisporus]